MEYAIDLGIMQMIYVKRYPVDICNIHLIYVIWNWFIWYAIDLWNMQLTYGIWKRFMWKSYPIDLCNMQLI